MEVQLVEGPPDAQDMVLFLLGDAQVKRRLVTSDSAKQSEAKELTAESEVEDETVTSDDDNSVPIRELWRTLLDAEEDAFFTVTVAGDKRYNPERSVSSWFLTTRLRCVGLRAHPIWWSSKAKPMTGSGSPVVNSICVIRQSVRWPSWPLTNLTSARTSRLAVDCAL